jgi:hydroxymethylpyrimidine pyrophosphatase-like HAD family hydrolase
VNLYCDIDGTLIDKDDNIRPFVKELFETAHTKGFSILVWSAGGVSYAKIQLERIYYKLNLKTPVSIIPKDFKYVQYKDFRSVCIDDMEDVCISFLKWGGYGYNVPYYESLLMSNDHYLKDIAEKL